MLQDFLGIKNAQKSGISISDELIADLIDDSMVLTSANGGILKKDVRNHIKKSNRYGVWK